MKMYFLTGFLIFSFGIGMGQSPDAELAGKVCASMDDVDFSMDETELNELVMQSIQNVYKEETELIVKAMNVHMEANEGMTQQEAGLVIGNAVRLELMDNCENFQRITMFKGKPVPEISDLTRKVGEEITEDIAGKEKNGGLTMEIIDKAMSEAMDKYGAEIDKQFGKRYSLEFSDQLTAYLQTESRPYMRWMVNRKR
ncbi:hypothetical protein AB9P05_10895 [Roseivirga sp. BDSF3-8]|uniref:hypothetical protein n=1 Tax=Roseivirga sp. BDSF3-8 TaxID=3241598 RepID=UPI003531AB2B